MTDLCDLDKEIIKLTKLQEYKKELQSKIDTLSQMEAKLDKEIIALKTHSWITNSKPTEYKVIEGKLYRITFNQGYFNVWLEPHYKVIS